MKDILVNMHQSTYTMEHYNKARQELKITTGLAHIGATRFWTYVSAVDSIYQGLPAFQSIVQNKKLKIDIAVSLRNYYMYSTQLLIVSSRARTYSSKGTQCKQTCSEFKRSSTSRLQPHLPVLSSVLNPRLQRLPMSTCSGLQ